MSMSRSEAAMKVRLAVFLPAGPVPGWVVRLVGDCQTLPDVRLVALLRDGAPLPPADWADRVDELVETAQGADALVIEATYCESEADLAREYGHLTAASAASLAASAGVKQLILTHLSRRYHPQQVLDEARAIFPVTAIANDFDRFRIVKGKPVELVRQEMD